MKNLFKVIKLEYLIHLLIMILFVSIINIPQFDLRFGVFTTGDGSFIFPSIYGSVFNVIIFYTNSDWLIPLVLKKKRRLRYALILITIFILTTFAEVMIDKVVSVGSFNIGNWEDIYEIIALVFFMHILALISSFGYGFSKDWLINERLKRKLIEEKLTTELAFLKSQISPHFLFNTLNNLFSMSMKNDDMETAEGIQKLAELMRYMLYTSSTSNISLQKEIDYLNNYIDLQRLRFKNSELVSLDISFPEQTGHTSIAPMLLIPFVENAFKYSVSMNLPFTINIKLEEDDDKVWFECFNTINVNQKEIEASGIGLENVKRRLQLLYPERHQLNIVNDGKDFQVSLKLNKN